VKIEQVTSEFWPKYSARFDVCIKEAKKGQYESIYFPVHRKGDGFALLEFFPEFLALREAGATEVYVEEIEDYRLYQRRSLYSQFRIAWHPVDLADYIAWYKKKRGLKTDAEVADELGISRVKVTRYIAVSKFLSPKARDLLQRTLAQAAKKRTKQGYSSNFTPAEELSFDHIYNLIQARPKSNNKLTQDLADDIQHDALAEAVLERITAKDMREIVQRKLKGLTNPPPPTPVEKSESIIYGFDNRLALSALEPDSIDLVETSTPFAFVGMSYEKTDSIPAQLDAIVPGLQVAGILLKPGRHFFLNLPPWRTKSGRIIWYQDVVCDALEDVGLRLQDVLTWDKGFLQTRNPNNGKKTIIGRRHMPNAEPIFHFIKGDEANSSQADTVNLSPVDLTEATLESLEEDGYVAAKSYLSSVIYAQGSRKYRHDKGKTLGDVQRAVMPDALAKHFIVNFSAPGETVLDPFAGTATTLRIAEKNERVGIGFEKNPKQIECLRNDGYRVLPLPAEAEEPHLPMLWRRLAEIKEKYGRYDLHDGKPVAVPRSLKSKKAA